MCLARRTLKTPLERKGFPTRGEKWTGTSPRFLNLESCRQMKWNLSLSPRTK